MATRFLLFLILATNATAQIIPNDRIISWDPGVRGGIPQVTNVAVTLGPTSTWWFIQSNITAAASNTAVELIPGVYTITNDILLKQGVVLRGQLGVHPTNYWLKFTNDSVSSSLGNRLVSFDANSYDFDWNANSPISITNLQQHSSYVTCMVAHALSVNDNCIIDQYTNFLIGGYQTNLTETNWVGSNTFVFGDAGTDVMAITQAGSLGITTWTGRENGKRPFGQFVRIKSVISPTVVEVEPPLYWAYNRSPEIIKINGWTERAGIENLTLDNLLCNARDNLYIAGAINCWMKDVMVVGSRRRDLWVYGALWFEQRGCYLYGAIPIGIDTDTQYTSDRAYPVFLGPHCTAGLFTDNVYEKKTMGFAFEGCAAGNVVSYNFITNIYWITQSDFPRRFSILMHGPHPAFNLIEGNWCSDRIRADEYWGSSSHFTVFGNSVHQHDRGSTAAQQWTIDIERHNAHWNFVGNLIGGSGGVNEGNYEYINGESAPYNDSVDTIWKIGYKSLGNDNTYYSTHTLSTIIRYANWCYRTNDTVSGSGITYHVDNVVDASFGQLPNSYYLKYAPTNFGRLQWPPYSVSNPTYNYMTNIPAGYRYLFGTNPPMKLLTNAVRKTGTIRSTGNVK